jgi:predicted SAM-dependent methyltransferase
MKLHLGCNRRYIPGFIHIDMAHYPHVDHNTAVEWLPMFEDNAIELIYASHVLEYFDRQEAVQVLHEWHRVLMPGGTLRLAVPDLEVLVTLYNTTHNLDLLLGPLYGRMISAYVPIYHRTGYDFQSLRLVLEDAGFCSVHRYDWRETEHAEVDDFSQAFFPHMQKETGMLLSLNVESTK